MRLPILAIGRLPRTSLHSGHQAVSPSHFPTAFDLGT